MVNFLLNWIKAFLYPRPVVGVAHILRYLKEYYKYRKLEKYQSVKILDTHPCLTDKTVATPFDAHYFYQGAWLARKLVKYKLDYHVDVGSSVMMVSILSALVKTVFVDYRALNTDLSNLCLISADIVHLPFKDNSFCSVSCQHVIEHIGLGRYGDKLDPNGSIKSAKELERIVKPGGKLFLTLLLIVTRKTFLFVIFHANTNSSVVKTDFFEIANFNIFLVILDIKINNYVNVFV